MVINLRAVQQDQKTGGRCENICDLQERVLHTAPPSWVVYLYNQYPLDVGPCQGSCLAFLLLILSRVLEATTSVHDFGHWLSTLCIMFTFMVS